MLESDVEIAETRSKPLAASYIFKKNEIEEIICFLLTSIFFSFFLVKHLIFFSIRAYHQGNVVVQKLLPEKIHSSLS